MSYTVSVPTIMISLQTTFMSLALTMQLFVVRKIFQSDQIHSFFLDPLFFPLIDCLSWCSFSVVTTLCDDDNDDYEAGDASFK